MKKEYDLIVYIGRFQPPHLAHIQIIEKAKTMADNVLVLIGSANQPRTIKNPWTWQERKEMIFASIEPAARQPVMIAPIRDIVYNNSAWLEQVQETVMSFTASPDDKIAIIGHSKDETSFYLKSFPQWKTIDVDIIDDLHATDIRTAMFESEDFSEEVGNKLPQGIHDYIKSFMLRPEYDSLINEYTFLRKYKSQFDALKYPPIFVTTDCVVSYSGHVLLVKRRSNPGKNLWALPGGFVNANETLEDAALRELHEETKLKVPTKVLRGSIIKKHVFDEPNRSLRGRTITHAYYIDLPPQPESKFPDIKGSDDALKAKWIPLSVIRKMEEQLFEDHFFIINKFLGTL